MINNTDDLLSLPVDDELEFTLRRASRSAAWLAVILTVLTGLLLLVWGKSIARSWQPYRSTKYMARELGSLTAVTTGLVLTVIYLFMYSSNVQKSLRQANDELLGRAFNYLQRYLVIAISIIIFVIILFLLLFFYFL